MKRMYEFVCENVDTRLRGTCDYETQSFSVSAVVQPIAQSLRQALTWKGGQVIFHLHG
jgi:hypothetical protein